MTVAKLTNETPAQRQFRLDMQRAGFTLRQYTRGYNIATYAVEATHDGLQDVIRATQVRISFETLGRDLIVYPRG